MSTEAEEEFHDVAPEPTVKEVEELQQDPEGDVPMWDTFGFTRRLNLTKSLAEEQLQQQYRWKGLARLDHFFLITERGSSFGTEIFGGTVTFFSMCYIMALNPIIVAAAIGMQWQSGLFLATALVSGVFTIAMGIFANLPVAVAPGMGVNSYFANISRVAADGTLLGILTWQQSLGAVMISGLIYLALTVTGIRSFFYRAVPVDLQHAISVGIGLFICFIGYKLGLVMGLSYYGGPILNDTALIPFYSYDIVALDPKTAPELRTTIVGFVWVALFLTLRFRLGILFAIVLTTFCGIVGNGLDPTSVTSLAIWHQSPIPFLAPTDQSLAGHLELSAAGTTQFWDVVWTFVFVELFEDLGTLATVLLRCHGEKASEKQLMRDASNAMAVTGLGLFIGAFMGSNSITCYIESLTGIASGARSGLAACWIGLLFLLSLLFVWPFVAIIPNSATVPALFMIGVYSIQSVKHINFDDFPTAFASFMIMTVIPFTFSIPNGMAAGFIFYDFCVILRWLHFRAVELWTRKRATRDSDKWVWESGWNTENKEDHLPHWVMVLVGIFMVLRFRFFFG